MSFSPEWQTFWAGAKGVDRGYEHNLSYRVQYHCGPDLTGQRVLELGCGQGPNVHWLLGMGADYWGVDGSESAVDIVHRQYPQLIEKVAMVDFTEGLPADFLEAPFDIVIDRASVPHNDGAAIRRCVNHAYAALVSGGLYFGVDWFSVRHSEFSRGTQDGDALTRMGYTDGQFAGVGRVHFSDDAEIADIFQGWEGLFLQERVTRRAAPGFVQTVAQVPWHSRVFDETDYYSAVYDFVARKP